MTTMPVRRCQCQGSGRRTLALVRHGARSNSNQYLATMDVVDWRMVGEDFACLTTMPVPVTT